MSSSKSDPIVPLVPDEQVERIQREIEAKRSRDDIHRMLFAWEEPAPRRWPIEIEHALRRAQWKGFKGVPFEWTEHGDPHHRIFLVKCTFPTDPLYPNAAANRAESLYVVVHDAHAGGGEPTMVPLSTAIHVLQNMTEDERWRIEHRSPR
jgi:hypothetical protein